MPYVNVKYKVKYKNGGGGTSNSSVSVSSKSPTESEIMSKLKARVSGLDGRAIRNGEAELIILNIEVRG